MSELFTYGSVGAPEATPAPTRREERKSGEYDDEKSVLTPFLVTPFLDPFSAFPDDREVVSVAEVALADELPQQ